jgi:hypothetical protein
MTDDFTKITKARTQWKRMSFPHGPIIDFSCSNAGLWATGGQHNEQGDYEIFHQTYEDNTWQKINGVGCQIAVDKFNNIPWVITKNGQVLEFTSAGWTRRELPLMSARPAPPPQALRARAIAIGGEQRQVWVISDLVVPGGYAIYKWDEFAWQAIRDQGAVEITVDAKPTPWIIDDEGKVWQRTTGTRPGWQLRVNDMGMDATDGGLFGFGHNGAARNIVCSPEGNTWVMGYHATNFGDGLYLWEGKTGPRGRGMGWSRIDGGGVQLAVAKNNRPYLIQDSRIYRPKHIRILDVWGEGRVVDTDLNNQVTGFDGDNVWNINKYDKRVSNGPNKGKKIPNLIGVASWYNPRFSTIVDGTVPYVTCMGAPITEESAAEMYRVVNKEKGAVILYGFKPEDPISRHHIQNWEAVCARG